MRSSRARDQKLLKRLRGTPLHPGGLRGWADPVGAGDRLRHRGARARGGCRLLCAFGVLGRASARHGRAAAGQRHPGSLRHRPGRTPAEQQRRRRCGPGRADAAVVLLKRHRLPGPTRLDGHSRVAVPAQAPGRLRGRGPRAWRPGRQLDEPGGPRRLADRSESTSPCERSDGTATVHERNAPHRKHARPGVAGGRRRAVSGQCPGPLGASGRGIPTIHPLMATRSHSWPRIRGHECDSGP